MVFENNMDLTNNFFSFQEWIEMVLFILQASCFNEESNKNENNKALTLIVLPENSPERIFRYGVLSKGEKPNAIGENA